MTAVPEHFNHTWLVCKFLLGIEELILFCFHSSHQSAHSILCLKALYYKNQPTRATRFSFPNRVLPLRHHVQFKVSDVPSAAKVKCDSDVFHFVFKVVMEFFLLLLKHLAVKTLP